MTISKYTSVRTLNTRRTTAAVVAMALCAMCAPVVAQEMDASRFQPEMDASRFQPEFDASRYRPEFDASRPGPVPYPFGASLTDPQAAPPLLYTSPQAGYSTLSTENAQTRVTITTGPDGRITTCFSSRIGARPYVNCF